VFLLLTALEEIVTILEEVPMVLEEGGCQKSPPTVHPQERAARQQPAPIFFSSTDACSGSKRSPIQKSLAVSSSSEDHLAYMVPQSANAIDRGRG
jgi:hypothetical protein